MLQEVESVIQLEVLFSNERMSWAWADANTVIVVGS